MEKQEIINKIIDNYENKKYGLIKSGKDFGLSANKVKKILKENNIHIRNHHESMVLSNKSRDYPHNEGYFSKDSLILAWILGFIAADGSIRKDSNSIKITLSKVDKEILEKIKEEIKIENPIKDYITNKGFEISEFIWTCEQHKKDLEKYNIIPDKTFKLKPPYKLNKEFWIDYIRGYFDGDGSVNLIKNSNGRGNGNLRWQVCGAVPEILQWIIDFLYEEYQIPKVLIQTQRRKEKLYYFQYSSKATRQIYNILYNDSKMFLKRKKEHYEEILNKITPFE